MSYKLQSEGTVGISVNLNPNKAVLWKLCFSIQLVKLKKFYSIALYTKLYNALMRSKTTY